MRYISLILAALMMLGVFTACGHDSATETNAGTATETEPETSPETETESEGRETESESETEGETRPDVGWLYTRVSMRSQYTFDGYNHIDMTESTYTYSPDGVLTDVYTVYPDKRESHEVYIYDDNGRLIQRQKTGAGAFTATFTYDESGLLIKRSYESSSETVYTYDAHRRCIREEGFRGDTPLTVVNYTYDSHGRLLREEVQELYYSNRKSVTVYTYNVQGHISQTVTTVTADPGEESRDTSVYTYDDHGRLTGIHSSMVTTEEKPAATPTERWIEYTDYRYYPLSGDEIETDTETESETLPAPTGKIEDPTHLYGFTARKQSTYFKGHNSVVTFNDDGSVTFTHLQDEDADSLDIYVDIAYLNMMRGAGFKTTDLPNAGVEPDCRAVVLKIKTNIVLFFLGTSFSVGPHDTSDISASYTEPSNGTSSKDEYTYLVYDFSDNYFFQGDWLNTLRVHFPDFNNMDDMKNGYIQLFAIQFYETAADAYAAIGKTYHPPVEVTPEAIPPIVIPTVDENATPWQLSTAVPADGAVVQTANSLVTDVFTEFSPRDTYYAAEQGDIYMPIPLLLSWEDIGADTYHVYISHSANMADPIWVETNTPMVTVDHLMTGTDYYWQVVAIHTDGTSAVSPIYTFSTEVSPRACNVEGVSNIRDLGGYELTSTTRIRQGLLYRSAMLDNVTEEGIRAALYNYGIRTDLDLRAPGEGTAGTGSPLGNYVRYINISGVHYDLNIKKNQLTLRKEFEVLANPDNYPILFHCTAGRDRTGTLAFLVGALLGESEAQLYMEYELTFLSAAGCDKPAGDNRHIHDMFMPQFERMAALLRSYAPAVDCSLSEAAEAYLLAIGVSPEDIQSVRDILIEEIP